MITQRKTRDRFVPGLRFTATVVGVAYSRVEMVMSHTDGEIIEVYYHRPYQKFDLGMRVRVRVDHVYANLVHPRTIETQSEPGTPWREIA